MKITRTETFTVGAGWKNFLFVHVPTHTGLIDPANGHFSLPTAPGLGLKLNLDVVGAHP